MTEHAVDDTARLTTAEPRWPLPPRPPAGAPNIVAIVLDDTGFAQLGCFGSGTRWMNCATPCTPIDAMRTAIACASG